LLYTPVSKREAKAAAKPSKLIVLMIMLVSLFAVGCGDSNNDFVVTGNNNPNPQGPGSLTFQFVKAQNVATVPQSTAFIRFDYLDAAGAVIGSDTEPFAGSITVTPPAGMVSVRITPLDGNGFPVVAATGPLATPPVGTNLQVDMSLFNFTTVTLDALTVTPDPTSVVVGASQQLTLTGAFSNGDVVQFPAAAVADATFTPDNSGTYTVSATGSVTGVLAGTGTLNVVYDGVPDTITVNVSATGTDVLAITPDPLQVGVALTSDPVVVSFTPAGGTTVTLDNADVDFSTDNAGFTPNADGSVSVASTVAPGTSATLTATWVDTNNVTRTDTSTVTAVNSSVFTQPAGETLLLPFDGFQFQTAVAFNGQPVNSFFANGYTFSSSNTDVATINGAGLLVTGDVGTSTISLLLNGNVVDTFTLTTADIAVTDIEVSPDQFNLSPGKVVPYSVMATYSNNQTADIAGSLDFNITRTAGLGAGDATFYAGRAIGGQDYGNATYTFAIHGATDDVNVLQAAGFISGYQVYVAGAQTGLIPQRFQAIVDVFATLDTGETIRLRPQDQFDVSEVEDDSDAFGQDGRFGANNWITDDGHDVGDQGTFAVTLDTDDFVGLAGLNLTREFNVQVVDNSEGVCSVGFTNYSDDPVMFESYARPITYLFSNGAVTNFKVSDEDASLRGLDNDFRTLSDIWGYPCLVDESEGDHAKGPVTIQALIGNDVLGTATMEVEVWHDDAVFFNPQVVTMKPGETIEVPLIVSARSNDDSAETREFSRALDFAYRRFDNSPSVFARRGNDCRVTALFPDQNGEVEARDVVSGNWVADLKVVILGDESNNNNNN
jgi:hypothetical protein